MQVVRGSNPRTPAYLAPYLIGLFKFSEIHICIARPLVQQLFLSAVARHDSECVGLTARELASNTKPSTVPLLLFN
jgi:hypothetical protein